jgi:hypothetical protein
MDQASHSIHRCPRHVDDHRPRRRGIRPCSRYLADVDDTYTRGQRAPAWELTGCVLGAVPTSGHSQPPGDPLARAFSYPSSLRIWLWLWPFQKST